MLEDNATIADGKREIDELSDMFFRYIMG